MFACSYPFDIHNPTMTTDPPEFNIGSFPLTLVGLERAGRALKRVKRQYAEYGWFGYSIQLSLAESQMKWMENQISEEEFKDVVGMEGKELHGGLYDKLEEHFKLPENYIVIEDILGGGPPGESTVYLMTADDRSLGKVKILPETKNWLMKRKNVLWPGGRMKARVLSGGGELASYEIPTG